MTFSRTPSNRTSLAVALVGLGLTAACATPLLPPTGLGPTTPIAAQAARSVHLKVPHRFQGVDMSCGPSALWSVMTFHLGAGKVNFAALDKSLRPTGNLTNYIGTMPGTLVKAPERYDLTATVYNKASLNHLRSMLDHGLPTIILGSRSGGETNSLHWVVVNGYQGQGKGQDTIWIITDSMVESGRESRWTTTELMAFWNNCKVSGKRLPYQMTTVNVAPEDDAGYLPEDNRTPWLRFLDATLRSTFDVLRWLDRDEAPGPPVRI